MKVAQNEKRKKLLGFSFYINIGNFVAFLRNLNLSTKHLFWRCAEKYGPVPTWLCLFSSASSYLVIFQSADAGKKMMNCLFVQLLYIPTLEYPINREKLIAVHNMEHPQKVNSQEANNCLFLDIFYLF